jgi:uncharacterized membrane protein YbhN (UPF0104 family)
LLIKFVPVKIFEIISNIRNGIYAYKQHKKVLIQFFLISILLQLLFIAACVMILKSISGHYFILQTIAFIPLIEIITSAAAFTPQGIGVREVLLVFFFKYLHLSNEALGLYILIIYLFSIVSRLLGIIPLYRNLFFKKTKH